MMSNVKVIVESIKSTVVENLVLAVREHKLTIDDKKLPGLSVLIRDSVDQAFNNSAHGLNEAMAKFSKKLND